MNNYKPPGSKMPTNQADSPAKTTSNQFKGRKRWMIAQSRNENSRQHADSLALETGFAVALARAKRLLAGSNKLSFERDYKRDDRGGVLPIYAFLTDSIYLYLECSLDHNYVIQFAFHNCSIEPQLKELLLPLRNIGNVQEVKLKPDFPTFYKNVLAFQPKCFQYLL
jgi:hypothetical protein